MNKPEPIPKNCRRNSYPKLRSKPLSLSLNRNYHSHKSYLQQNYTPLPKPESFTLSKVTEKLYLGSEQDVRSLTENEVSEKGITKILSVQNYAVENIEYIETHSSSPTKTTENNPEITENISIKQKFKEISFLHIKASDVTSTNLIDNFERCIDFIDSSEGATIVHCQAGISRSATICLAYLIKTKGFSLDQAFDYLKTCRSCIGPNFGFLGQLKIYEQRQKMI